MAALVQITVQLEQQQQKTAEHQSAIGDACQRLPHRGLLPGANDDAHHDQRCNLAEFDTEIEEQNLAQQTALIGHGQVLQPGRQTEAVNQSETEDHDQQAGRRDADPALKAIEVFKTLVHYGCGDHRVDQIMIGADACIGGEDQCERVAQGEGSDEFENIDETGQEEHHAEQEQQMVVTGEHVFGASPDVVEDAAVLHALAGHVRHVVGQRA